MNSNFMMSQIEEAASLVKQTITQAFRYSALSINLINKSTKKDYDISELTRIHVNLRVKDHRLTKTSFKLWVIGNCLTNMLEAFNNYIDTILKIKEIKKNISSDEKKRISKGRLPVNEKLEILTKIINSKYSNCVPLFVFTHEHLDAIDSIRQYRNCIVHHNGKVKKNNSIDFFELKWFYIKDYILLQDGSKIEAHKAKKAREEILDFGSEMGLYSKKFRQNDIIVIAPRELYQIGIFIQFLTSNILGNFRRSLAYDYPEDIIIF